MTDIIALPEMTRGLELRLWDAYHNNALDDADDPMEAVVEAYLSEAVRWQPIEPSDIRPGMRVRQTWRIGAVAHTTVAIVKGVDTSRWVYFDGRMAEPDLGTWEVDPRTIPIDPDQPLLDALRGWILNPEDARNLLASLREIADVTPKEGADE